jgi:hypothetical protein
MNAVSPASKSIDLRCPPLLRICIALLVEGLLTGASQRIGAQPLASESVAYAQPQVIPGEFNGDLSKVSLAPTTVAEAQIYRPLLRGPASTKFLTEAPVSTPSPAPASNGGPRPPMPDASESFAGLSHNSMCTGGQCGSGWPPDPNGDIGPNHYIEAVNSAIGIYSKTGTLLASFTEDNLWSGVGTTPCNGNSQGDPVVIYDWLADRFVLTWFAFPISAGNPVSPFYQCIAASKTADPVAGGYWLYAIRMDPGGTGLPPVGDLNDYGKFGLWHDCLYMGANEFAAPNFSYDGVAFASFSRSDMYGGLPLTAALGHIGPASNAFTMVPSNNQATGANAAQPGTPNYFVSQSGSTFALEVRKFTAGTNCGGGGSLGAATNVSETSYTFQSGAIVPQPNTTQKLDMIDDRVMQKVQYRKIGGVESLWVTHPVGTASGTTAMQWVQLNVTGGTVTTSPVQQQIYAPDTTLYRFMGSLAVDKKGNMALGYTTSNAAAPNFPSLAYSGRLATDPLNTLPQTEVQLIAGAGSQANTCGGHPCNRWGDYSSMSLDPADECTFWYTNEYYSSQANGTAGNWQNRIGSFKFPSCASVAPPPVFAGAVSRKVHGGAGTFDLPLSLVSVTNPTTEPRLGPVQTIVLTFNKAITAATATITEGTATAAAPTFSGNDVIVGLTGVTNKQYVTVALTNVASSDGGSGGSGSVRIGFLAGDVNQSRVVTVADVVLVNAQITHPVTAANYLKDLNASGAITVGDKVIANANVTKALPAP